MSWALPSFMRRSKSTVVDNDDSSATSSSRSTDAGSARSPLSPLAVLSNTSDRISHSSGSRASLSSLNSATSLALANVPPIPTGTPEEPHFLLVLSPNGQQRYCGCYVVQESLRANGSAVWRQSGGGKRWLYTNIQGRWCFGEADDLDAANENLFHKGIGGHLQCTVRRCEGRAPDSFEEKWCLFDQATNKHKADPEIEVVRCDGDPGPWPLHLRVPLRLLLRSPSRQRPYSGVYRLSLDASGNGMPAWRQSGGRYWLYSGPDGRWCFCGDESRVKRSFQAGSSRIYNPERHGGLMPNMVGATWMCYDEQAGDFVAASDVTITEAPDIESISLMSSELSTPEEGAVAVVQELAEWGVPPKLFLTSRAGQQMYAGEYQLQADEEANGFAVWKQAGGAKWLYSSPKGKWCFGGDDVKAKDFRHNGGFLYHSEKHGADMPDRTSDGWLRFDSGANCYLKDAHVRLSSSPPWASVMRRLFVDVLLGQKRTPFCGIYNLVQGLMANGFPVWRHSRRMYWLYTAPSGRWCVSVGDSPLVGRTLQPVAFHSEPHGGKLPEAMGKGWVHGGRQAGTKGELRVIAGPERTLSEKASVMAQRVVPTRLARAGSGLLSSGRAKAKAAARSGSTVETHAMRRSQIRGVPRISSLASLPEDEEVTEDAPKACLPTSLSLTAPAYQPRASASDTSSSACNIDAELDDRSERRSDGMSSAWNIDNDMSDARSMISSSVMNIDDDMSDDISVFSGSVMNVDNDLGDMPDGESICDMQSTPDGSVFDIDSDLKSTTGTSNASSWMNMDDELADREDGYFSIISKGQHQGVNDPYLDQFSEMSGSVLDIDADLDGASLASGSVLNIDADLADERRSEVSSWMNIDNTLHGESEGPDQHLLSIDAILDGAEGPTPGEGGWEDDEDNDDARVIREETDMSI